MRTRGQKSAVFKWLGAHMPEICASNGGVRSGQGGIDSADKKSEKTLISPSIPHKRRREKINSGKEKEGQTQS